MVRFLLPPPGSLAANNADDPLPYYYRPMVGRVFRRRIDIALELLRGHFKRLLEIGYGSGLLMPTLQRACDELYGADLEAPAPGLPAQLAALGAHPRRLVQADVRALPFDTGFFDAAVAISILEHLRPRELDAAVAELARVVAPGGALLVGVPAVHKAMNAAFRLIGFAAAEQHHFSSLADILAAARPQFFVEKRATMPSLLRFAPVGLAPYNAVLLRRHAR